MQNLNPNQNLRRETNFTPKGEVASTTPLNKSYNQQLTINN